MSKHTPQHNCGTAVWFKAAQTPFCMLHYKVICHNGIWWNRGIAPLIRKFGTKWESVVTFKPQLLYPYQEGTPRWSLNRRLGGPYTWSDRRLGGPYTWSDRRLGRPYIWSGHFLEDKRFITPARQESNPGLSSLYGGQLTGNSILDMTIKNSW